MEITNDAIIKQGLFPAPGTKTEASNTKAKGNYCWDLCKAVFEDHPEYKEVFSDALADVGLQKIWGLKIKNKLAASVFLWQ